MALSVDSTTNLHLIDAAESVTGWTFSGITKQALATNPLREGTNCIGGQIAVNTFGYAYHTHGSSINMTTAGNERVYIWVLSAAPGTFAQSGWMVLIGDGTNRRAYRVGGSNDVPFSVNGWYCLMLDTANLPTTYQQEAGGAVTLTAVTQFGFGIYNTGTPSGNALNVWFDVVRYGSGIIVTSGATDDISLSDIAADDASSATGKAYGIIREIQPGVYGIQGDIILGDTAGNSIDWKESNAVVIFEDRVRGAGTNTAFKLLGQHSATGTFRTELGVVVSSGDSESGRSGVIFVSANSTYQPVDFDFSDTDIEDVLLYGCGFNGLRGTIAFSADATNGVNHHISGCTFSECAQVSTGRTVVRNSLFAATGNTGAALLWNENINIKRCNFIGNTVGAAIEHSAITSVATGTVTTADATGTTLIDSAASFLSTVAINDYIYNETDGSYGKVTSVDSNIQLTCETLQGGTDNDFDSSDAYSVSPAEAYTDLTFSGNTTDVANTATGSDGLFVSKTGTSNPATKTGNVVFIGSVILTITVQKDDAAKTPIQNAQVSIHLLNSPFTELMNEDTDINGEATQSYTGSTGVDIVIKVRKSDDIDDPRYRGYSTTGQISASGFSLTVTLKVNPFI